MISLVVETQDRQKQMIINPPIDYFNSCFSEIAGTYQSFTHSQFTQKAYIHYIHTQFHFIFAYVAGNYLNYTHSKFMQNTYIHTHFHFRFAYVAGNYLTYTHCKLMQNAYISR